MEIDTQNYVDKQIEWQARVIAEQKEWLIRYIDARFDATGEAVEKYNETNNERWVGANEFRGQLKDQAGTFVTRKELWLAVIAMLSIVIAALGLVLKK